MGCKQYLGLQEDKKFKQYVYSNNLFVPSNYANGILILALKVFAYKKRWGYRTVLSNNFVQAF